MKGKAPQKARPAWENNSLGFIEAVHQWQRKKFYYALHNTDGLAGFEDTSIYM